MNKRSEDLAAKVEALRAELLELDAVEAPTDEQVSRSTAALAEYDTAAADLEAARAYDAKMDVVRSAVADPKNRENGFGGSVYVNAKKDPFANLDELARSNPRDIIARATTALSEVEAYGVDDSARENAVRSVQRTPGAALHALVAGSPAYMRAFDKYMANQGDVLSWERDELEAIQLVRTALNITTGASGQFLLPTLFDPTLILTGTAVRDGIRDIARVEQVTQNVWNGVSAGNVTAYWTAEAGVVTDGSPTLAHPAITAAKLTAYVPGSYEVFEDASQVAQLPMLIAQGMDFVEQTAFISGSGSGAPKGIVTAISATAGSTVTITTRGSFTTASSVDVYAIVNAVPTRYENSSTWVANKATYNLINQMSPSGGGSLFWQNFNANTIERPPLLGYPIQQASDVANTYASGTVFAILGDFSRYLIVDRIGVTVEYIPQVFDQATARPLGQRALIAHKRVGGDVLDVNAFRFLKA